VQLTTTALDHCQETGTTPEEWEETDGPDFGVGVDHYFAHTMHGVWYVSEDQGVFAAERFDG
jgi:hypothetical protein